MPDSGPHQAAVTLWWFIHRKYQERPRKLCVTCDFLPLPLGGQQFTTDLYSLKGWETEEPTDVCVCVFGEGSAEVLHGLGFLGLLVFHALVPCKVKQGKQRQSEVVLLTLENSFMLSAVPYSVHKQLTTRRNRETGTLMGQKISHISLSSTKADNSLQQDAGGCYQAEGRCWEAFLQTQAELQIPGQTHPCDFITC